MKSLGTAHFAIPSQAQCMQDSWWSQNDRKVPTLVFVEETSTANRGIA
jgi:hypothetical protein